MNFLDVGPLEFLVIIVVALLVFGPDKLPEVLGQAGHWIRKARSMADEVTREFTRELNLADASKPSYNYTPPIPPPPAYVPPEPIIGPPETFVPAEPAGPLSGPIGFIAGYGQAADPPASAEPMADPDAEVPAEVSGPIGFISGYQPVVTTNGSTNGIHQEEPVAEEPHAR